MLNKHSTPALNRVERLKETLQRLLEEIEEPYSIQCTDEEEDELITYIEEEPFFCYQIKIKIVDRSI